MFHLFHSRIRNRPGSVLLLTLLVMAATLAVVINLAAMVMTSFSRSRVSSSALTTFYRAESGMERALYRVRQLRLLSFAPELGLSVQCDNNLTCAGGTGGGSCLPGCTVKDKYLKDGLTFTLRKDQSVEIDLVDVTAEPYDMINNPTCTYDNVDGGMSVAACVNELRFYCQAVSAAAGQLVVTYTTIADVNFWSGSEGSTRQLLPIDCDSTSRPHVFNGASPQGYGAKDLMQSRSYAVKFRAIKQDIKITNLRAYLGLTERPLFSQLELTSTAKDLRTSQQLQVVLPGRAPVIGLTDYVVYSECGITKPYNWGGNSQQCPLP